MFVLCTHLEIVSFPLNNSNAIAKSKRPGKALLASQFLQRMVEVSLRPSIVSYNNVLNACAFSSKTGDDPKVILNIAMEMLNEAQEGPGANWISYQTALRVIGSFEKDSGKTVRTLFTGLFFVV